MPIPLPYTMGLDKRIPNEINYQTPLFDDLLVMPQTLSGVNLTLYFDRDGEEKNEPDHITVPLDINWQQGVRYIYTLIIGDNKEEIYFNVLVDEDGDWIYKGGTDIDVE